MSARESPARPPPCLMPHPTAKATRSPSAAAASRGTDPRPGLAAPPSPYVSPPLLPATGWRYSRTQSSESAPPSPSESPAVFHTAAAANPHRTRHPATRAAADSLAPYRSPPSSPPSHETSRPIPPAPAPSTHPASTGPSSRSSTY